MAVLKACPRCRALIPQGLRYCSNCAPIMEAKRADTEAYNKRMYNKAYNKRRDPKYREFYNSTAWRAVSRAVLSDAGYRCTAGLTGCTGLAVEVHHIKPIQTSEGWELRLDVSNLEPLCTSCHNGRHPEKCRGRQASDALDVREIMNSLRENNREKGGR